MIGRLPAMKSHVPKIVFFCLILFVFYLLTKSFLPSMCGIAKVAILHPINPIDGYTPRDVQSDPIKCPPTAWIPPIQRRVDLGSVLHQLNFKTGVELGVQMGLFMVEILSSWKTADEYVMVDLWKQQKNYNVPANVDDDTQEARMNQSIAGAQKMKDAGYVKRITVCQNYTTECVKKFRNEYFDFIYVDARHSYTSVLQDITEWWPKLKPGGIMAGHDYVDKNDAKSMYKHWATNADGTMENDGRLVRGAVNDFFSGYRSKALSGCPRQVTVTYRERGHSTWAVRK